MPAEISDAEAHEIADLLEGLYAIEDADAYSVASERTLELAELLRESADTREREHWV